MGDRNLDSAKCYGKGNVDLDFSFLTNGAANPVASSFRGTSLGDAVASVVYAATGQYTVTLKDKYRYVIAKLPDLEDIATPDGGYATIGPVSGEGNGKITFVVATFAANGTPTAFTGRRLSIFLRLKNSTVGV